MPRNRPQRKIIIVITAALLSLASMTAMLAAAAPAAPAAVFNVNSFGDVVDAGINGVCATGGGVCTLRAAIMEANHLSGTTINVPAGMYLLTIPVNGGDPDTSGNLNILASMSIIGAGSGVTFIDGNGSALGDNVFFVSSNSAVVTISGLTIQHGSDTLRDGGGIGNDGKLTLSDTVILENGTDAFLGGGIYNSNQGFLALTNSSVQGNRASGVGVAVPVQGCGGIYNLGVMTVTNSTIISNTSGGDNATGGGLCNGRALSMNRSAVVGNQVTGTNALGGGLYNFNAIGALSLINSTFSGNRSDGSGGGIANASTLPGSATLYNVTVANNVADADLDRSGSGGGIFDAAGTLNLRNSLLGGNLGLADCTGPCTHQPDDCRGGTLVSQDYNLIQTTTGCTLHGTTTHDASGDPLLGGLALNGGQTLNHALGGGSPAIDAGNAGGCLDSLGAQITVDQRGAARPFGPRCDIGSFESTLVAPAAVISGPAGGLVNALLAYTATVSPLTATQPITYVWQATGQSPVTHTAAALSDTVSFQWNTAGPQWLTVTVGSAAGTVQAGYGVTISNPLPTLSAISPAHTLAGGLDFTLTVTGTNFVPSSVVRWNGSDRATTFIGGGEVQALIPAPDISARGVVTLTVFNPAPGGGETGPAAFGIWGALYLPLVRR